MQASPSSCLPVRTGIKRKGRLLAAPVSLLPFVFHHAVNHGHIHFYIVQPRGVNLENIPVQHDQICQLSIFNAALDILPS